MPSGWGKRLASSFLLALGAATATWFGIGFGIGAIGLFTAVQQMAGTGAMFFFVFGAGMAADTADAIKEATATK